MLLALADRECEPGSLPFLISRYGVRQVHGCTFRREAVELVECSPRRAGEICALSVPGVRIFICKWECDMIGATGKVCGGGANARTSRSSFEILPCVHMEGFLKVLAGLPEKFVAVPVELMKWPIQSPSASDSSGFISSAEFPNGLLWMVTHYTNTPCLFAFSSDACAPKMKKPSAFRNMPLFVSSLV